MSFAEHEEAAFAERAKEVVDLGTFSPRPRKPVTMDFPDAMREVISGKAITKLEWDDSEVYGLLSEGRLKIFRDGKWFDWIISDGDLSGEDWVVK